jgi:hypothetical protein
VRLAGKVVAVGCKNVLVACEFSGVVRDAFTRKGHNAVSIDLEPTLTEGQHIQGDVLGYLKHGWDLMIAHPPCTYLSLSGNRWYSKETDLIQKAIDFILQLYNADIPQVAVENPVGRISTLWRKPDQYVQPWMFGHGETKKTGLWLKNLPLLMATDVVEGRKNVVWKMADSKGRAKRRSITYQGIADAMAAQWGCISDV